MKPNILSIVLTILIMSINQFTSQSIFDSVGSKSRNEEKVKLDIITAKSSKQSEQIRYDNRGIKIARE
jgi:hypothetical protein